MTTEWLGVADDETTRPKLKRGPVPGLMSLTAAILTRCTCHDGPRAIPLPHEAGCSLQGSGWLS